MQFIHSREHLRQGDVVVVDCSDQSNVFLTDDMNFNNLKNRLRFSYLGGHASHFPIEITVPKTGYWNITIDFANKNEDMKYSIKIITTEYVDIVE